MGKKKNAMETRLKHRPKKGEVAAQPSGKKRGEGRLTKSFGET